MTDARLPRRDWTRKKKGNKADGTDGAHIVSREILQYIYDRKVGPKYSSETHNQIMDSFNLDDNIRIKSQEGNRSRDRQLDSGIMMKYRSGKKLTKDETERAARQIKIILNSKDQIPDAFIQAARIFYHGLTGYDGKSMCRINAAASTTSGSRAA